MHGTEALNTQCQKIKSGSWLQKGNVDGIGLFDKVIQTINRPPSRPLHGYDFDSREKVTIDIYNGELGTVVPTGNDWKKYKWNNFFLQKFSVQFAGKTNISVNYGGGRDKPELNLELAYAISVHKSQGSEFDRVYLVVPGGRVQRQDMELLYTALTRAQTHCTLFVQDSVRTLVNAMRPEQSALMSINSSLFDFSSVPDALQLRKDWYEAGKIHEALTGDMVRSKSEVIIANMFFEREIDFRYECPLIAEDGSMYLPDFTIKWRGIIGST